jgi:hypothetical protein
MRRTLLVHRGMGRAAVARIAGVVWLAVVLRIVVAMVLRPTVIARRQVTGLKVALSVIAWSLIAWSIIRRIAWIRGIIATSDADTDATSADANAAPVEAQLHASTVRGSNLSGASANVQAEKAEGGDGDGVGGCLKSHVFASFSFYRGKWQDTAST